MDPQVYKQQLLRTLQDQQVKKIDYFTIRKQDELYKSNEMEPTQSYNQFANQNHMIDHLIKDAADNRKDLALESPSKGREQSRRQEITFDKSAECSIDSSQGQRQATKVRKTRESSSEQNGSHRQRIRSIHERSSIQRKEIAKLCRSTQFIPIVLMWCPSLLAGQPCNCGHRCTPSVPNIKEQVRLFVNLANQTARQQFK